MGSGDKIQIIKSLFYGLTGGSFTPGRIGEYGGRGLILNDKPFISVSAATMVEKLFVLAVEIVFGSAALSVFIIFKNSNWNTQFIFGMLIILLLVIIIYMFRGNIFNAVKKITSRIKFFNRNPELIKTILTIDKKYIHRMFLLTTLFFLIYTLQFVFAAASFTNQFDFTDMLWAAVLIMFSKTVLGYFSFGELGIREGAAVYFFTLFGYEGSAGFNAGIIIFLINIILPALAGLVFSFMDSKNA